MRIGIDIGGTFTDFVLFDEAAGSLRTYKRLSTPHDPAEAVLAGLADLGLSPRNENRLRGLEIVHGSTVATNALLERKGAAIAFVATSGFRDLLAIGRQNRTRLYDFLADRPEPLAPAERCFEVVERVDCRGQVVTPLDDAALARLAEQVVASGAEAAAVCLLFSFANPAHEQRVGRALAAAGLLVSLSSEILPEFREYERASTTAINAYVAPVLDRYLGRLAARLGGAEFRVLQSNGGSIRAHQARREAVRSILSGPAGGAVGAFYVAQAAGFPRVLTFDMGGTSTDVSLCDGGIRVTSEGEVGGLPVRIPIVDIHTVGAGGGSLAQVDAGGALQVGPQSAGADPGPACYGRGGVLPTVTDANLVLGRLPADRFLGGAMPLDASAAEAALARLAEAASLTPLPGLSPAQTAALGVVQVANAHMERALRVISVQRGHDPADFALLSFGGAGGLHASALARSLGVATVIVPPLASTLSAFGMLAADVVKDYVQTVMLPGTVAFDELEGLMRPLAQRGLAEVAAEGVPVERITLAPQLDVRYRGQAYELTVPLSPAFADAFHAEHARAYGYSYPDAPLEVVNLRLVAVGSVPRPPLPTAEPGKPDPAAAYLDTRPVVLDDGLAAVPFFDGAALRPGHRLTGPALVVYPDTTVLLHPGDRAAVDRHLNLIVAVG
ncbi:MAG: hydantoinase/oxoprolinase family protein, partial [Anaerolineae bacterium]|nr:hydantoinase/oxoprolinase family protein [Anaerolineae bacterium]